MEEDEESRACVLSITVTSIDYYLAPPLPALDVEYSSSLGLKLKRVPVLRIFGASTLDGRKACLHLHRVFPYLLVPAIQSWPTYPCEGLNARVCQLAKSVEHALRENQRLQNEEAGRAAFPQQDRQHVLKAQIVRGVPMYGCHLSERLYVKIYFLDPADVQKAAGLLTGGACMGHVFQPYQSHIPYILQAMCDLNLVGMAPLDLSSVTFREPRLRIPRPPPGSELSGMVPAGTMAKLETRWSQALAARPAMVSNGHERMSTCDLEVDALACDVLNRARVKHLRLTEGNRDTKMVETLAFIWKDVRKHNTKMGGRGTLDMPLSSSRSHSCTPLGMAAMFGEKLKSQAEKEAAVAGEEFQIPPDERVEALAQFKAISDFFEIDAQGSDDADLRREMLSGSGQALPHHAQVPTAAAVEPVVDTQMVRQLSISRSQRILSQRLGFGASSQVAAGCGAKMMVNGNSQAGHSQERRSQDSDAGDLHRGAVDATPQSQEVLDVFAWMEAEDAQDQGASQGPLGFDDHGEAEEDAFDPVKERVKELQLDAELQHAHDILQCTQGATDGGEVSSGRMQHIGGAADGAGGGHHPAARGSPPQDVRQGTMAGRLAMQDSLGALSPRTDAGMDESGSKGEGVKLGRKEEEVEEEREAGLRDAPPRCLGVRDLDIFVALSQVFKLQCVKDCSLQLLRMCALIM